MKLWVVLKNAGKSHQRSWQRLLGGLALVGAWQAIWSYLATRSLAPLLATQNLFDNEWLARPDSLLVELAFVEADVFWSALSSTFTLALLSPFALLPSRALLLVLSVDSPPRHGSAAEVGRLLAPLALVTSLGLGLVFLFWFALFLIFGAWFTATRDAAGGLSWFGASVALAVVTAGSLALALFRDASAIGARRALPLLAALDQGVRAWKKTRLWLGRALKALGSLALSAAALFALGLELSPNLELFTLQLCAAGWVGLDFAWFTWLGRELGGSGEAAAQRPPAT